MSVGQSLMCVTVGVGTSNNIAGNLMIDHPYMYSKYLSPSISQLLPNYTTLMKGTKSTLPHYTMEFESHAGDTFYQFAKSSSCRKDLWDDFVSPYFGTALNVETWRNGAGGR